MVKYLDSNHVHLELEQRRSHTYQRCNTCAMRGSGEITLTVHYVTTGCNCL